MYMRKVDCANSKLLEASNHLVQYNDACVFLWGFTILREPIFAMVDISKGKLYPLKTEGLKLHYDSASVLIDNAFLFICGGKHVSKEIITNECYVYDIYRNSFKRIESMWDVRHGFSIYAKDSMIYVFGGRIHMEKETATNKCECYNIKTGQWRLLPPMGTAKYRSKAFGYKNQIWVIGGCVEDGKLGVIDIYDIKKRTWSVAQFKLPKYLDIKEVLGYKPDKILILASFHKKFYSVNLAKGSIKVKGNASCVFTSLRFAFNPSKNTINCFCFPCGLLGTRGKVFDFKTSMHRLDQYIVSNPVFLRPNVSSPAVEVSHVTKQKIKRISTLESVVSKIKQNYLFGTYNAPFIITIDSDTHGVRYKPMPLELHESLGFSCIKIPGHKILFVGAGFGYSCVVYDILTKRVNPFGSCNYHKYFSSLIYYDHSVYAIGGIIDGSKSSICERYCFEKRRWLMMPSLLRPVAETFTFVHNNKLYVCEKNKSLKRFLEVHAFNCEKYRWELGQIDLIQSIRVLDGVCPVQDGIVLLAHCYKEGSKQRSIYFAPFDKGLDLASLKYISGIRCSDYTVRVPPKDQEKQFVMASTSSCGRPRSRRNDRNIMHNNEVVSVGISLKRLLSNKLNRMDFDNISVNRLTRAEPWGMEVE